jgi:hypothetical protein
MDPGVRELVVLSSLVALGCGLAATHGDLLFVALFGTVSVVTIIETVGRGEKSTRRGPVGDPRLA